MVDASWQQQQSRWLAAALQPGTTRQGTLFVSPDAGCSGVLAGEIFNLDDLMNPYPAALVHPQRVGLLMQDLYGKHGDEFALAFDGCYGIVMAYEDRYLAVRDAIGERPLYVLHSDSGAVLADTLAPLLRRSSRKLHAGGVADFMGTGFCPFERTTVADVSKLAPGSVWTLGNSVRRHTYHVMSDVGMEQDADEPASVRKLLERAVKKRLSHDKKSILFLSGGLDSSLVGALVGGEQLSAAYSISFGAEYRNELEFSALMAEHLGIPHRVISFSARTVTDAFPETMAILDEPVGDPLNVPNILLAREAAAEAEVIFNGEGGDPLFGGPKNLPLMAHQAFAGYGPKLDAETIYLMSFNKGSQWLPQLFSPDYLEEVRSYQSTEELLGTRLNSDEVSTLLNRLMLTNLRLKGAAQILPKVFKAAGAAGVTVCSPLFDRHLAEAAFQLPDDWKQRGVQEKYILKEAVRDLLPASILQRPKSGMLVPVHYWLRGELRKFAAEILLDLNARTRDILDRSALLDLLNFRGGGVPGFYGDRIWLLLSLEFWMQAHDIRA
ncbi:MAG: asparagine synthase C-terminal domain-containing protein [Pseudomonadales bacterium]|jgi:asparagine synthase (glutamine-hydrolysing)|nr:asparagine synthase C-terminal domain-containing protein [Pseudomonadales bacterium]